MNMLLGYNGNPKLRRAYTEIAMTEDQVQEYKKCLYDPIYFIKKYMKIVVLGKGLQPFDLYPFQENMITTFIKERFIICKIPRQSGKSITTIGFLLHSILFNENYNCAVLAHKGQAANGLLGRLKLAYENLPTWLQSGIVEWNKGNIELENGSKIGAFATSADGLRSGSYDCITGDSIVTIRENGNIKNVSIESLFHDIANSSRSINTNKKGIDSVYTKQIHKMVFSNNRECEKKKPFKNNYRKSSYYTEMYEWNKHNKQHGYVDYSRTYNCSSSIMSYGSREKNKEEITVCISKNDQWSARNTLEYEMGRSGQSNQKISRSSERSYDGSKTYRRNQREDALKWAGEKTFTRIEKYNIKKNEGSIYWKENVRRDQRKNETISTWKEKVFGSYNKNQPKSRKNPKNCRKASWYEAIRRSKVKNELSQKREVYTLEQRIEIKTPNGFRQFDGIKRIKSKTELIEIILINGNTIKCTPDHLLMTENGWTKAIHCNDYIKTSTGFVKIINKNIIPPEYVYDILEVENDHCFFANDILVHNCVLLDEFAFVPNNIAEEFFTSTYPVISAGNATKIIIVSTPKGMNHFYTMWLKAEQKKSDYIPIEVHWSAVPGRDNKWREETIRNTSEEQFTQEFECVAADTIITIRDKQTGKITETTIEKLSLLLNSSEH